jgi:hypothetical protein
MKKKSIIAILCICLNLNFIYSQTPQEIIDSFFKTYQKNEPVKALDDLYSHAPWLKDKNESIENLKTKFAELKSRDGECYGYELLNEKNIKNTFAIYTYLVKHENSPLLFTFEFYKPNKDWIVYSFSYDYNFVVDMEKKAKDELFMMKK